jgi:hypothetical protein
LILCTRALPTVYYVDKTNGSDSYHGLNWQFSKKTINAAMSLVNGSDSIHVAAGTYNEKVAFNASNQNQLIGGYPPGGGTKNHKENVTIISRSGSGGATITVPPHPSGFGYGGIVIDGFTIRNGTGAGIYSGSLGVTIKNCIIEQNSGSSSAGGIFITCDAYDTSYSPYIENCIIQYNSGSNGSGGICFTGSEDRVGNYSGSMKNVLVVNNTASSNYNWAIGGVNVFFPANISMINCTIADNQATGSTSNKVAGVRVSGINQFKNGYVSIKNSIIWHPTGDDLLREMYAGPPSYWLGYLSYSYCDIEDTSDNGTGVIHEDPNFVGNGNYSLLNFKSPCCDSAKLSFAPAFDIDNIPRPNGYGVDIGAYEYIYGDFFNDRNIGMWEFRAIVYSWQYDIWQADLWPQGGDGIVNWHDLAMFGNSWQLSAE